MTEAEMASGVKNGMLVYVSSVLLLASIAVFFMVSFLAPKIRLPIKRVFPSTEEEISSPTVVKLRDASSLAILLLVVVIPSIFVAFPMVEAIISGSLSFTFSGSTLWGDYWRSMLISYGIGLLATLLNVIFGLPIAILIARRRLGRVTSILRAIINVPIIVPSIVLGVSLRLFWEKYTLVHDFWALLYNHNLHLFRRIYGGGNRKYTS